MINGSKILGEPGLFMNFYLSYQKKEAHIKTLWSNTYMFKYIVSIKGSPKPQNSCQISS